MSNENLHPHPTRVAIVGGVACNRLLRRRIRELAEEHGLACAIPSPAYCTDNAAMVAFNALPRLRAGKASRDLTEDAFPTAHWTSARPESSGPKHAHR